MPGLLRSGGIVVVALAMALVGVVPPVAALTPPSGGAVSAPAGLTLHVPWGPGETHSIGDGSRYGDGHHQCKGGTQDCYALDVNGSVTTGTAVHPLFDGTVVFSGCAPYGASGTWPQYGRVVYVEKALDGAVYGALYAHLSESWVTAGEKVDPANGLGRAGSTYGVIDDARRVVSCDANATDAGGNPTNVHLHFAVYRFDQPGLHQQAWFPYGGHAVVPEPLVGVQSYQDLATYTGGLTAASSGSTPASPGDPAAVERKPVDLPTRLPWPAGTTASITEGYGQGVVPGHWASVRFGLDPGSPVVAATIGDILYAGPATGRFAGLGNIVIERRMVGGRDFELLYTGLAKTESPVSFIDPDRVIGTAGTNGLGFAIFEGAQLVHGTDTGLIGGTPVYPEPLLGDGLYEHLRWWSGPMTATSLAATVGDPGGTWAKGSTKDGGHVDFGDKVDLVARVHDTADLREVRFTAYYRDWADPKAAAKLDGFDPKRHWRILAVCRPDGVEGTPPATNGCDWKGDTHEATVTFRWDPTKAESEKSIPWLPRADAAISKDARTCTKVRLSFDVHDTSGYRHLAPDGLRAVQGCDERVGTVGAAVRSTTRTDGWDTTDAAADGPGRLVYLDPAEPPPAPRRLTVKWSNPVCSPGCVIPWRLRWNDVDGEAGYRIYVVNRWDRILADCRVASGKTDMRLLGTVGRNQTSFTGRFPLNIDLRPGGERFLVDSTYYVASFNEAGRESRRIASEVQQYVTFDLCV